MTYLQPVVNTPPLMGQDLNRFVQQWMAGVIGTDNLISSLIRPAVQDEPPVIPDEATAWMGFTAKVNDSDTFAFTKALPDGSGTMLIRQERIDVLCSFYDTGTNGQAAMLASLLRDGLTIPDNLETLTLADFGLVGTESEVVVPSLLSSRWLYRVDLPFRLSRQVTRVYATPNIESAAGTLYTDTGLTPVPILAEEDQ